MKKVWRILFTGIGRRVELIQEFRSSAEKVGCFVLIYGADISDSAPALFFCDCRLKTSSMKDSNYILQLEEICVKNKIDILIPTIDTDLLTLSEHKLQLEQVGTKVLVSSYDKIAICRDKNKTAKFFEQCGLKTPNTVSNVADFTGEFPCFIKPQDGSSSVNAFRVDYENDLKMYAKKIKDYIIQPFIDGTEYTVDILCDFEGKPIFIIPRERIAVRSGEVLKTRIDLDACIIRECEKVVEKFKPCGPITVQLIQENSSKNNYYIEINPRFGGGAPLSMKAGGNSAEMILRLLMNNEITRGMSQVKNGSIYSRFDQSICVENVSSTEMKAIIFDLDDTLYCEEEYVRSGYNAIEEEFCEFHGIGEELWIAFREGKNQPIDYVLKEKGVYSEDLKQQCLEVYRKHKPSINISESVRNTLKDLAKEGIKMGIITDGRPEGQRNKIKALGLDSIMDEIIITDEIGGIQFRKPNDIAFRIMKDKLGIEYEEMMYIGDNVFKDFIAPRKLGMQYLHFYNKKGIYFVEDVQLEESVGDFEEITKRFIAYATMTVN